MEISSINNLTAQSSATQPLPQRVLNEDQRSLVSAVKTVNAAGALSLDSELTLGVDPETRQVVVYLVNRDTRDVVEQIPAEFVLRLAQQLNST